MFDDVINGRAVWAVGHGDNGRLLSLIPSAGIQERHGLSRGPVGVGGLGTRLGRRRDGPVECSARHAHDGACLRPGRNRYPERRI